MTKQKAKEVFAANPSAKKVYFTSDGQPFIDKQAAANHQATVNRDKGSNKKITSFDRESTVKKEGTTTGQEQE